MPLFDIIAFDADDTLWHNERLFVLVQTQFIDLLTRYHSREWVEEHLYQTEVQNLQHFGFGVKAFALSMIETAVELTEGRVTGREIQTIITWAKDMLNADIELLEHVTETITHLTTAYNLMLITKGDLLDQQLKIERSTLAQHFKHIEIVSDKKRANYEWILAKYGVEPKRFLMVGNSIKSDILPVLEMGGNAIYVPYELTWKHEMASLPAVNQPGFYQIEHLGMLPALLEQLERENN
jgi:putative hydrolase of the HAD superfamily